MSAADNRQVDQTKQLPRDPRNLIKRQDVEFALRADKGQHVHLKSFIVIDFTLKGDNFGSVVLRIEVMYTDKEMVLETSYVSKVNPCRPMYGIILRKLFQKEIGFYCEILPQLNRQLERVNEPNLRIPRYFHSAERELNEVIYLEDLRRTGYKLPNRKNGMDKQHTELVLEELARMHAASALLMSTNEFKNVELEDRFPVLKEAFEVMIDENIPFTLREILKKSLDQNIKLTEMSDGYKHVAKFLCSKRDSIVVEFLAQLKGNAPFNLICHGDCWKNNFMFRYDEQGDPAECRLLDLQVTRMSSPAVDLNYFLYCSLSGRVRREHMTSFFNSYYASFARVLAGSGISDMFSLTEFKKEYYAKNLLGLIIGMMFIPVNFVNSEDAFSFDEIKESAMKKRLKDSDDPLIEPFRKNPHLVCHLLTMYEEMNEVGLFTTNSLPKVFD